MTTSPRPIWQESEEDAALSDDELLAKYEVENPETIEDEARLDAFWRANSRTGSGKWRFGGCGA